MTWPQPSYFCPVRSGGLENLNPHVFERRRRWHRRKRCVWCGRRQPK